MNMFRKSLLAVTMSLFSFSQAHAELAVSTLDEPIKPSNSIFRSNVWSSYQIYVPRDTMIGALVLDVDESSNNGFSQINSAKVRIYSDDNGSIGDPINFGSAVDSISAYIPYQKNDGDLAYFDSEYIFIYGGSHYWVTFTSDAANVDFETTDSLNSVSNNGWSTTGKAGYIGQASTYTGYTPLFEIYSTDTEYQTQNFYSEVSKILDTSTQIAYLISAPDGLKYRLTNKNSGTTINWDLTLAQVTDALNTNDYRGYVSSNQYLDFFEVGPKVNWFYSESLFDTNADMTAELKRLLELAQHFDWASQ